MVELVHHLFVSILKGKVNKSPFIDKIVVNTFNMIQQFFLYTPEDGAET